MAAFEYRQAQEIRDVLARYGVRYLFIGKSGAILLGFPDTTQDVDLFVERSRPNGRAMVAALRELGFTLTNEQASDIEVGKDVSKISKGGTTLNIVHLAPAVMKAKAVETPHYLKTLRNVKPLKKEGMITVSARTDDAEPLVMANILTSEDADNITAEEGDGFILGTASGQKFAFTTNPDNIYDVENMQTDALSMSWDDNNIFVASATVFYLDGALILKSDVPVTFELSQDGIKYYHNRGGELIIGSQTIPSSLSLNGNKVKNFDYNAQKKHITMEVAKGEGIIVIN